jgi:malate dehydrogenase (oxaloacetate-decarboxylating)(NADP+)
MAELVGALKAWQPHVLLQFEDFGNHNAFRLLSKYQDQICCFNDDIQGTACITLAGILAALRVTGRPLSEQVILFYGAGEAGTGIGELIALALHKHHRMPMAEARRRCFFMDSQGLVCASRQKLQAHKIPFAHDVEFCKDLTTAIHRLKPTALIGVSTIAKAFDGEVLKAMASINERPIIFPLSNPTSKSECTFAEAVAVTNGQVVFASGSPFPPLTHDGLHLHPAQANNAYIFPCVGHAAVLCQCRSIPEDIFLAAAYALADMQPKAELLKGHLFPPFAAIKDVSAVLGGRVLKYMCDNKLGSVPQRVEDWEAFYRLHMWGLFPTSKL